jgi:hypothetical protein
VIDDNDIYISAVHPINNKNMMILQDAGIEYPNNYGIYQLILKVHGSATILDKYFQELDTSYAEFDLSIVGGESSSRLRKVFSEWVDLQLLDKGWIITDTNSVFWPHLETDQSYYPGQTARECEFSCAVYAIPSTKERALYLALQYR